MVGHVQRLHGADQQALLGLGEVAAAEVGMGAGQDQFAVFGGGAVEGEVGAVLVPCHQVHHGGEVRGRQVELERRAGAAHIAQVGQAGGGCHGVEQADERDPHPPAVAAGHARGEGAALAAQYFTQQPARASQQFVGEVPGCRRAAAEAEDIQGQRVDFVVGVFLYEAVAGSSDVPECLPHLRLHAGIAAPSAGAEQAVLLAGAGADALDIDAAMGQPGFAIGRNLSCFGIQVVQQLDIGHAIAVAALRVTHIGLAAGVQVLFGDGVLGAAEQALGGVGGIVVGAIEEHAEAQGDAQFRWGLPYEPLFAGGGGRRGRGNCVAGITAWKGSPFQARRADA
ncbi:hypothetical protein D9M71_359480 [compost metagenome]